MKHICLDTHVLIWGIREYAPIGQEEMIPKTKGFFEECKNNNTIIMVPSIVVGELLTAVDIQHHAMILNLLSSSFSLPPYDAQASAIFAKLWREKKESGVVKEIQNDLQATRQELKADCMIVATAIARKADVIYSHDAKLKKFANGSIEVLTIPSIPYQESLELIENTG